jgi:sporulation protein YlmC with PRC-barrel domain
MRLSDLLGSEVITQTQQRVGRVHEVRAVQDGPLQGNFGAALRIDGIIVGRGSLATRFGLDRKDVKSPAAIRVVLERIRGRRLYVPWSSIIAIEEDRVIAAATDGFPEPEELSSTEQIDIGSTS